ncbi:MAG: hypothetical protein WCR51_13315 [Planctomycetia bacterium]
MKCPEATCHVIRQCVGIVALTLLPMAGEAMAQSRGQGRSGGLLPTREVPSISGGATRDELLRRFDLDADGRIDESEAEAGRARMRRERVDTMQNSGLDPLTGRPRGAAATGPTRDEPPPGDDDVLILPGAPDAGAPPPKKPAGAGEKKPAAPPAPAAPSGRAPPLTGGVRAGAPAVRQGYGAAQPKADLNAGRPRDPRPMPNGAAARPGMPTAGRPLPTTPAPRSPTQRQGLFPQNSSRPTAEDFGR